MPRSLSLVTALGIVLLCGLAHGLWTDRWKPSVELEQAVERLDRVPLVVGDWQGTLQELSAGQVEMGELTGYRLVRFENRQNQQVVMVLLAVGRSGPLAAHTPEVCYRGAGYEVLQPTTHSTRLFEPLGQPFEFQTAAFGRWARGVQHRLRIYWSWNARGTWTAPNQPRIDLAAYPVLFKLYVFRDLVPGEQTDPDPCLEFMRVFLPALDRALTAEP